MHTKNGAVKLVHNSFMVLVPGSERHTLGVVGKLVEPPVRLGIVVAQVAVL